jgi:hypothetical protein
MHDGVEEAFNLGDRIRTEFYQRTGLGDRIRTEFYHRIGLDDLLTPRTSR